MVIYAAFNSISVISRRQLTLFMSFLGFTSTRLGSEVSCPRTLPRKNPEDPVRLEPRTPGLRVKHFTTGPRGTHAWMTHDVRWTPHVHKSSPGALFAQVSQNLSSRKIYFLRLTLIPPLTTMYLSSGEHRARSDCTYVQSDLALLSPRPYHESVSSIPRDQLKFCLCYHQQFNILQNKG